MRHELKKNARLRKDHYENYIRQNIKRFPVKSLEDSIATDTRIAISYGINYGLTADESKDFAQNFVIKKYVDKKSTRLKSVFVDWMRSDVIDIRTRYYQKGWIYFDDRRVEQPDELYDRKEAWKKKIGGLTLMDRSFVRSLIKCKNYKTLTRQIKKSQPWVSWKLAEIIKKVSD